METKAQIIDAINAILKENGLDRIILENAIHTHWPDDDTKTFMIHELRVSSEGVSAWQGYGYKYSSGWELKYFGRECLVELEKELQQSVKNLKTFRVKVIGYVDIKGVTKPEHAREFVQLHPNEVKKQLLWIEPTNEIKKI